MENKSILDRFNKWLSTSITIKIISIAILVLLLLIPTSMIESLIQERQARSDEAINEVSDKWARAQTLAGPVLNIPFLINERNSNGQLIPVVHYAHFLPEELKISGKIDPEIRYRGIYKIPVYKSNLELSGFFRSPSFSGFQEKPENILWSKAFISIGIPDMRGIKNQMKFNWNNQTIPFDPGIGAKDLSESGAHADIALSDSIPDSLSFNMAISLNGSSNLMFIPMGKQTSVHLESAWQSPSFAGAFLPDTRTVNKDGFIADWNILHLNRNFPQAWTDGGYDINPSAFGVELLVPVDEYQKSARAVKYAILMIALTFLIFFFVEVLNKKPIHPFQYILAGLALCLFYSLLIAFSEYVGFNVAYLISAFAILSLLIWYFQTIFGNTRLTLTTGAIMIFLYAFIFFILQLEDYALLIGSIGLFVLLAIIMNLARKIQWYEV